MPPQDLRYKPGSDGVTGSRLVSMMSSNVIPPILFPDDFLKSYKYRFFTDEKDSFKREILRNSKSLLILKKPTPTRRYKS